ncbi:MAG: ABC transporter permease [Kosmotoga sp.]|nr:MAG: ABC transporter permease [Kosmotoga sp.]
MSIRRMLNIFKLDLKNSLRDKIMIYIMIAPILLAILFKIVAPDFQQFSLKFVVLESSVEVAEQLNNYGLVEVAPSYGTLKNVVANDDDTVGVYMEDGKLSLLLQGNESDQTKELAKLSLTGIILKDVSGEIKTSDLGKTLPPTILFGFCFTVILSYTLGGLVIGFNIIDEKESEAMKALMITPISKNELIVGRSIVGIVVPIIHALLAVLIFGVTGIDILQLVIITLVSSIIGIVLGFFIGVISSNQMTGIANMKISVLLLLLPVLVSIVLPENQHFFLYWAPTYWSFTAISDILTQSIGWTDLSYKMLWIAMTTGLLFIIISKKTKTGLKTYLH